MTRHGDNVCFRFSVAARSFVVDFLSSSQTLCLMDKHFVNALSGKRYFSFLSLVLNDKVDFLSLQRNQSSSIKQSGQNENSIFYLKDHILHDNRIWGIHFIQKSWVVA